MSCSVGDFNNFLASNSNLIEGKIADTLRINKPWLNVFPTREWQSGVSDIRRSVVQQIAASDDVSFAAPDWNLMATDCAPCPTQFQTGSDEYQYQAFDISRRGPNICLSKGYNSVVGAIRAAESTIVDKVGNMWNAFLRYQAYFNCATKIVCDASSSSLEDVVSGGYQCKFKPGAFPDSPISFKFLRNVQNYLCHVLLAGDEYRFGNGNMKHYRFISDKSQIDNLRTEDAVILNTRALATGANRQGIESMLEYEWQILYQGLAFGVDETILRADGVNADGSVDLVEPLLTVSATKGQKSIINPAWQAAPYQISFLIADGSFAREIPVEWIGEGMTKFQRQYWGGQVQWHNVMGPTENIYGDTGFHKFRLGSAFRPERPEFVIAILHTRCAEDLGLTPCVPSYYTGID